MSRQLQLAPAAGLVWMLLGSAMACSAEVPGDFADDPGTAAETALLELLGSARADAGLPELSDHPVLARVARERVRELLRSGPTSAGLTATTDALHDGGYKPWHWREATVCCDIDADLIRAGRVALSPELVEGDWEHAAAACASGAEGEFCLLVVALQRITVERRQSAPLADRDWVRAEVLAASNRARSSSGRPTLERDQGLDAIAQAHAEDMLSRGYYDHKSPEGVRPAERLRNAGWAYREVAENIARGLYTPTEVVDRWLESSSHRRNLLHKSATRHGLGVAVGERDGDLWVYWCQLIATPKE